VILLSFKLTSSWGGHFKDSGGSNSDSSGPSTHLELNKFYYRSGTRFKSHPSNVFDDKDLCSCIILSPFYSHTPPFSAEKGSHGKSYEMHFCSLVSDGKLLSNFGKLYFGIRSNSESGCGYL
jgi:hypothetical protein